MARRINLLNKIQQSFSSGVNTTAYVISKINAETEVNQKLCDGGMTSATVPTGIIVCGESACGDLAEPPNERCI